MRAGPLPLQHARMTDEEHPKVCTVRTDNDENLMSFNLPNEKKRKIEKLHNCTEALFA